jgi:hypothetical protein
MSITLESVVQSFRQAVRIAERTMAFGENLTEPWKEEMENRANGMMEMIDFLQESLLKDNGYDFCGECGELHEFHKDCKNDKGDYICDSCLKHFEECIECNQVKHEDDMVGVELDRMCERCVKELSA